MTVTVAVALVDGRRSAVAAALLGYGLGFALVLAATPGLTLKCRFETWPIVVLDLGIVAAVMMLRRTLAAHSSDAERYLAETARVQMATAGLAGRDQVRSQHLERALSISRPLMQGLPTAASIPGTMTFGCAQGERPKRCARSMRCLPNSGTCPST